MVAIAYGEANTLARSATTLASATLVVIGLAAGLSALLPQLKDLADNAQITSSVFPTLVDLVVAAATGLAGAFAIAHRDVSAILSGCRDRDLAGAAAGRRGRHCRAR